MFNNLFVADLEEILFHIKENSNEFLNKSIFATGCTGFFGIWIIESFLYINKRLNLNTKMTILTRNKDAFLNNHIHLLKFSEINFIEGDICSFEFPRDKYDFIIHGATQVSASLNIEAPHDTIRTIIDGTKYILEFAKRCDAKKFLFISSGAAYGKQSYTISHISEDSNSAPSTLDPRSAYGEAKRLAELLCILSSKSYGLEVKIARCFAFVGPYLPLNTHFAIGNFINDALLGKDIVIKSDGSPLRSYLYASDLALWLWKILINGKNCEIYNVGSDKFISMAELASLVSTITDVNSKVIISERQIMEKPIERYVPSIKKAAQDLSLKPLISLEVGIKKTFDWYKNRKENVW